MNLISQLKSLKACQPAIEWVEKKEISTLEQAWKQCEKSEWMIWLLEILEILPEPLKKYCYCGCNTKKLKPNAVRVQVEFTTLQQVFDEKTLQQN